MTVSTARYELWPINWQMLQSYPTVTGDAPDNSGVGASKGLLTVGLEDVNVSTMAG